MGRKIDVTTASMRTKNPASGAMVRNGARTQGTGKCRECFFKLKYLSFVKWGGGGKDWLVNVQA